MTTKPFHTKTEKHNIFHFLGIKLSIRRRLWKYNRENSFLRQLIINNIKITELKPITGELRENQLLCIEILERVKELCDNNNLKYWLDSGTLLGAVRHKGFIPWDDDIDLCMLRKEYNVILPLLKKEFKNDKKFFVRERAIKENNFQIRIRCKEKNVGLDIFPVDYYYKSQITIEERNEINQKLQLAIKLLNKKYKKNKELSENKIQEAKEYILNLQKEIVLNNKTCKCKNPILFFGIDFPSDAKSLVFEYKMVFPLNEIDFEGKKYFAPNETDKYLENFYSNYMEYPQKFT